MKKETALIDFDGPVKPCVGCGFCCLEARCIASVRLYPIAKRCPELKWDKTQGRYICKLMTLPGDLGAFYRAELYAGAGCCSSLNNWRKDVKPRLEDAQDPEND